VATSSSSRRRWDVVDGRGTQPRHHVLDPRTGAPTDGPVQVTVVAGRAGDAEVLTKVGMVGGVDALRPWLVAGVEAYVVGSANVLVPVGASPQPSASRTG
jgi:thiamine biosynthesis lipoprotein